MLKKIIFFVIVILVIVVVGVTSIEVSYFIYKKLIRKEEIKPDQREIDFSVAGIFQKDFDVGYVLKPNVSTTDLPGWKDKNKEYDLLYFGLGKSISTNAAGYRGKLYAMKKRYDTLRILTVGGSTTWGCFNDDGWTWPECLERVLSNIIRDKKIEVINVAVGGYNSAQNLIQFKKKWRFLKPDILLVACWFNDIYPGYKNILCLSFARGG